MCCLPKAFQLLFLLFLFCFQANLSSCSSSTTHLCSPEEAAALIQFKTSLSIKESIYGECDETGTKSYPKTDSWKVGSDCCTWDGVSCDHIKGLVIGLDLSCSQLYGTFPSNSTLFHLPHLQKLNLAFNDFNHSKMSSKFGGFSSTLVYLNLSHTFFAGQVPSQVSHLSKLVSLDLSLNFGDDPIRPWNYGLALDKQTLEGLVENLTELRHLALDYTDMSSINPNALMNLSSSLRTLSLKDCCLRGKFPASIFQLPNLESLSLGANSDLVLYFPKLNWSSNFESLDISGMSLSTKSIDLIGNLKSLKYLDLSSNSILRGLPESITNLSSLRTLSLNYCDLRGNFPASIFHLPNLESLNLGGNSDLILYIPKLNWSSNLESLDLSAMSLSTRLIDSIGNFKSLKYLDLSHSSILGGLPESITNLSSLEHLDASYSNFSGGLPDSIGNLVSLEYLDVRYSNLSGSIPRSLGYLSQLTHLDLSSTSLSGRIPSSFTNVSQLEFFDISKNQLEGSIPEEVTAFPNLIYLDLSFNLLNGTLPSWLYTISTLKYVDLQNNQLSGDIKEFEYKSLESISFQNNKLKGPLPSSISQLLNLTDLDLSSNHLSGIVEFDMFSQLQSLQTLDLSHNIISSNSNGTGVDYTLPNLLYLYLASCNFSEFPHFLRGLERLLYLDLSSNKIQGRIPKWMWDVGKEYLLYLNLSHNSLTDFEQVPWQGIQILDLSFNSVQGDLPIPPSTTQAFLFSNNSLSGEIPSLICDLNFLIILDLSHNNLSGSIPQCFGNLSKSLSFFNLQRNKFSGIIPTTFTEGCGLRNLNLNGNQLEGPLTRSIINCSVLQVLDLGNNKINDTFPHWLGILPHLRVLILQSNQLHGSIQETRSDPPLFKIQIFDLSNNYFTGSLPVHYIKNFKAMIDLRKHASSKSYMGHYFWEKFYSYSIAITLKGHEIEMDEIFIMFTSIDLSNNEFEGEIPKVIGELKSLKGLNLSHNNLTGHVLTSLGNLAELESLDLSSNKLVGRIPTELTSLTYLAVFNLSKNQLLGPIPQGKQFSTFGNDSYAGNLGLCGLPVSKSCDKNEAPISDEKADSETVFEWKAALMGYGSGLVFGISAAYIMFTLGKPFWLVKVVEVGGYRLKRYLRGRRIL